jgi:hypothetical protein
MKPEDTEIQEIFKNTQQHLKESLARLATLDAPPPALFMYTRFISDLNHSIGIHQMLAKANGNPEEINKIIQALLTETKQYVNNKTSN